MPRRTWNDFAGKALAAGLAPETPALAILNATRADQRVLRATVKTLGATLAALPTKGPCLVMYGMALKEAGVRAGEAQPPMARVA